MKYDIEKKIKMYEFLKHEDIYKDLRFYHENYVIFMKYGNFYRVFDEDTYILNYLTNYKIYDNRLGFPISEIDRIISLLNDFKISYVIYNKDIIINKGNNYNNYLKSGKEKNYKLDLIKYINDLDITILESIIDNNVLISIRNKYGINSNN